MRWLVSLTLLIPLWATGQSGLPRCSPDRTIPWHNCIGEYLYSNGERYVGEWREGKFHGRGAWTNSSGHTYVGEWSDGKRSGLGTYTYPNGSKYAGSFLDGRRHGHGTATISNGEQHVGGYKDDKRHGFGIATFSSGARYVGEYLDGKRHGRGVMALPTGQRYVGEWRDGRPDGEGIEYAGGGAIVRSGTWRSDLTASHPVDTGRFPFAFLEAEAARIELDRQFTAGLLARSVPEPIPPQSQDSSVSVSVSNPLAGLSSSELCQARSAAREVKGLQEAISEQIVSRRISCDQHDALAKPKPDVSTLADSLLNLGRILDRRQVQPPGDGGIDLTRCVDRGGGVLSCTNSEGGRLTCRNRGMGVVSCSGF
jgi:hypothetical protein